MGLGDPFLLTGNRVFVALSAHLLIMHNQHLVEYVVKSCKLTLFFFLLFGGENRELQSSNSHNSHRQGWIPIKLVYIISDIVNPDIGVPDIGDLEIGDVGLGVTQIYPESGHRETLQNEEHLIY